MDTHTSSPNQSGNRSDGDYSAHKKLSPDQRLRQRSDFRGFFDSPEVIRLWGCTVFRKPNEVGHFRLGMTLKVKAPSHLRNAVKRRVREAFRNMPSELGAYDYNVVIAKHRRLDFPFPNRLYRSLSQDLKSKLQDSRQEPEVSTIEPVA